MKRIISLLGLALAFGTILYTAHYVASGDICRTIFGCTAILAWALTFKKENTK